MTYPIAELFAWIVDDPTEEHGIVAIRVMGALAQAVTSRRAAAERMQPDMAFVAQQTGCAVKLQRFVFVETIEEIVPA